MTERGSSLVHVAKRGRHLYTTTAPSCYIPAPYCNLSAILQTISITVDSLQDNRAVFGIFIARRHLYTTTAPSCCIPAPYCHLSATLQTISITVDSLQDNRVCLDFLSQF